MLLTEAWPDSSVGVAPVLIQSCFLRVELWHSDEQWNMSFLLYMFLVVTLLHHPAYSNKPRRWARTQSKSVFGLRWMSFPCRPWMIWKIPSKSWKLTACHTSSVLEFSVFRCLARLKPKRDGLWLLVKRRWRHWGWREMHGDLPGRMKHGRGRKRSQKQDKRWKDVACRAFSSFRLLSASVG